MEAAFCRIARRAGGALDRCYAVAQRFGRVDRWYPRLGDNNCPRGRPGATTEEGPQSPSVSGAAVRRGDSAARPARRMRLRRVLAKFRRISRMALTIRKEPSYYCGSP